MISWFEAVRDAESAAGVWLDCALTPEAVPCVVVDVLLVGAEVLLVWDEPLLGQEADWLVELWLAEVWLVELWLAYLWPTDLWPTEVRLAWRPDL